MHQLKGVAVVQVTLVEYQSDPQTSVEEHLVSIWTVAERVPAPHPYLLHSLFLLFILVPTIGHHCLNLLLPHEVLLGGPILGLISTPQLRLMIYLVWLFVVETKFLTLRCNLLVGSWFPVMSLFVMAKYFVNSSMPYVYPTDQSVVYYYISAFGYFHSCCNPTYQVMNNYNLR